MTKLNFERLQKIVTKLECQCFRDEVECQHSRDGVECHLGFSNYLLLDGVRIVNSEIVTSKKEVKTQT